MFLSFTIIFVVFDCFHYFRTLGSLGCDRSDHARAWRRHLATEGVKRGAGKEVESGDIDELDAVAVELAPGEIDLHGGGGEERCAVVRRDVVDDDVAEGESSGGAEGGAVDGDVEGGVIRMGKAVAHEGGSEEERRSRHDGDGRDQLLKVHWLRVILDEGHTLGASGAMTSKLNTAVALRAAQDNSLSFVGVSIDADTAKADEKRECGLHAAWGGKAVAQK